MLEREQLLVDRGYRMEYTTEKMEDKDWDVKEAIYLSHLPLRTNKVTKIELFRYLFW